MADFVEICIPSATAVAQARTRRPFDSTMHVSQGLNRTELRVVADVRNRPPSTIDQIDEEFVGLAFLYDAVNRNLDHSFLLHVTHSKSGSVTRVSDFS